MILYHGSIDLVVHPEIRQGEVYLDFGVGFYTTTSYEQAKRWAKIKMRRNNTEVLHDQWTLHTEKALSLLTFRESKEIR